MRSKSLFWLLALLTVATTAFASSWTKDDHEIFDLVSELETHEGKGTDFYKFLDVNPAASVGALNRAYRKRSLELHPDKNPNVPDVHERFARLGKIAAILRNSEKRERYDFFYKNGVPRWRGTGYYYSRYRPGIFEVVLFLVLVTTGVHYLILRMNHRRDLSRIDYFRRSALRSAGVSTPTTNDASTLGLGRAGKIAQLDESSVETALNQAVLGGNAAANDPSVIENSGYSAQSAPTLNRAERRKQLRAPAATDSARSSREGTPTTGRASSVIPGGGEGKRRKVKVPLIEGSDRGGSLDLMVVDREVFIPEPHGGLTPLSALAPPPSASALWPLKLVASAVSLVRRRISGVEGEGEVQEISADEAVEGNKVSRRGKPGRVESPMASMTPSEDEGEPEQEQEEAGAAVGAKKKRRNGNGKVAGMRRRKAVAGK